MKVKKIYIPAYRVLRWIKELYFLKWKGWQHGIPQRKTWPSSISTLLWQFRKELSRFSYYVLFVWQENTHMDKCCLFKWDWKEFENEKSHFFPGCELGKGGDPSRRDPKTISYMPDLTRGAHSSCYEDHYADKNQVIFFNFITRGWVELPTLIPDYNFIAVESLWSLLWATHDSFQHKTFFQWEPGKFTLSAKFKCFR